MIYESLSIAPIKEAQYTALFDALPGNYHIISADASRFTIIASTPKMLTLLGLKKEDVVGKGIFEVFPSNPHDSSDTGVRDLRASLLYVLMHKGPHQLPTLRYDVANEKGDFIERYWRVENRPVLTPDGEVAYIIHSSEDITDQVKAEN
jgi:PAS domain S-box-containing protein